MILWEGDKYDSINKLDLDIGLIDLNYKEGGSYFTKLPISPREYRKKHSTKYSLSYEIKCEVSIFKITNDWGKLEIIEIDETPENMPFIEANKNFCGGE